MYRILFFLNINLLLLSGCARNDLSPVDIKIDSDINMGAVCEPNTDQQFSNNNISPNEYKVHEGETIFTIASKLDLDPMNLAAINKLFPPYKVYKGQIIKIPDASAGNFNQSGIKEIELPQAENSPKAEAMQGNQDIGYYEESKRKTEVSSGKKESLEKLDGELKDFLSSSDNQQSAQQKKSEDGETSSSLNAHQAELLKAPKITKPVINKKTKEQDKKPIDMGSSYKNVTPTSSTKYKSPVLGKIISNYGENLDGMPNDGINIQAPLGTKVKSIDDGKVIYVGDKIEGHGNIVVVKHKNGLISTYAHLNDVAVKNSSNVKEGQILGSVGKTGDVNTPQLHLEIMKNKQPVNPTKYINIRS